MNLKPILVLSWCLALTGTHAAKAQCPSSHLEPTLDYGAAFGDPDKVTTKVDLGPSRTDEALVFQYFEYQSAESRENGYSPVFAVHVLNNAATRKARVVVARLQNKTPVLVQAALSAELVEQLTAIAAPIVRETRYRAIPCEAVFLDGYVIQAGVAWPDHRSSTFIGGEAYAPVPGSGAARIEAIGRALRAFASGKMNEPALASALQKKSAESP